MYETEQEQDALEDKSPLNQKDDAAHHATAHIFESDSASAVSSQESENEAAAPVTIDLRALHDSKLNEINHQLANFIALYEAAAENIESREKISQQRLEENMHIFNKQIEEIKSVLTDFQLIMTQAGAARWRVAAEKAYREGKEHLEAIQTASNSFKSVVQENMERIDHISASAANRITEASKAFRIEDFKRLTEENSRKVNKISLDAIKRISKVVRWFHWEGLGTAVVVALLVSLLNGYFVNDELPWETHKKVVNEREAGKAVIEAWSQLDQKARKRIKSAAHTV